LKEGEREFTLLKRRERIILAEKGEAAAVNKGRKSLSSWRKGKRGKTGLGRRKVILRTAFEIHGKKNQDGRRKKVFFRGSEGGVPRTPAKGTNFTFLLGGGKSTGGKRLKRRNLSSWKKRSPVFKKRRKVERGMGVRGKGRGKRNRRRVKPGGKRG